MRIKEAMKEYGKIKKKGGGGDEVNFRSPQESTRQKVGRSGTCN